MEAETPFTFRLIDGCQNVTTELTLKQMGYKYSDFEENDCSGVPTGISIRSCNVIFIFRQQLFPLSSSILIFLPRVTTSCYLSQYFRANSSKTNVRQDFPTTLIEEFVC